MLQQPSVKMFDHWRALAATKGLSIADPASQLPDAEAALVLFREAGFKDVQVRDNTLTCCEAARLA